MGDVEEPIKRPRGRPPKNPAAAAPDPVDTAPESADVDRGEEARHLMEGLSDGIVKSDERKDATEADAERDNMETEIVSMGADLTPAQIAVLDHDHNGQAGGSYPKASLTEQEMIGFLAEFREAYESQTEQKRVDQFNRIWTFGFVIIKNQHTMRINAKRGPVEAEKLLNSSWMPDEMVREAIEEVSRRTER